jgi:hypothetical protein
MPILPDVERETLPLSLVRAAGGYLPLKLRAFLDFVTPRLKARLSGVRDGSVSLRRGTHRFYD